MFEDCYKYLTKTLKSIILLRESCHRSSKERLETGSCKSNHFYLSSKSIFLKTERGLLTGDHYLNSKTDNVPMLGAIRYYKLTE